MFIYTYVYIRIFAQLRLYYIHHTSDNICVLQKSVNMLCVAEKCEYVVRCMCLAEKCEYVVCCRTEKERKRGKKRKR